MPTVEPTPKQEKPKVSDILIDAFISEAFLAPSDAIMAVQLAAKHPIGAYTSGHFLLMLQQEADRAGILGFLSSYMTTASFRLMDEGHDSTTVFVDIARIVIPYDVHPDFFLGGKALYDERFNNRTNVINMLIGNPLLMCLVFLRLNMEKIMLTLNSLGEYRIVTQPAPSV